MKAGSVRHAKVTDDKGFARSKVPIPVLKAIGAKPGDHLTFKVDGAKTVTVKLERKRKGK